jgi:hypothetical protein
MSTPGEPRFEQIDLRWARERMSGARNFVEEAMRGRSDVRTIMEQVKELIAEAELGVRRSFLIRGEEFSDKERNRLWFMQWQFNRGMLTEWPRDRGYEKEGL